MNQQPNECIGEGGWALSWCPAHTLKRGTLHGSDVLVIPGSSSQEILKVMQSGQGFRVGVAIWIFCDEEPDAAIRIALESFYSEERLERYQATPPLVISSKAWKVVADCAGKEEDLAERSSRDSIVRALDILRGEILANKINPVHVADALDSPVMLTSILEMKAKETGEFGIWLKAVEMIREAANGEG
jgi:3',5'-cyclic AMP phosphodiesterase CpdA